MNASNFLKFSDYKIQISEELVFSPYNKGKT